ncbi:MAG: hypothetical protein Q9168_008089 [Polycauliona sp. 1 TL-2023]
MAEPQPDPVLHVPTDRADVADTGTEQRPRKYADGRTLHKKNSQGMFMFVVKVVSATYKDDVKRWEYTLKDLNDVSIEGTTKETDLG